MNAPSIFRQTARELAAQADEHAQAGRHQLGRCAAELGLLYLEFETNPPPGEHGRLAWDAAEEARESLAYGTAVGCGSNTSRARLHLALAALDEHPADCAPAAHH
ncbi:hypothetical protein [Streptomyces sp. NPDC007369]|uniref:hypothetical protein n=1 Tax=Streptomyces sp. NPDC007369 TaxID=3154589 RepID=UPI0033EAA45E